MEVLDILPNKLEHQILRVRNTKLKVESYLEECFWRFWRNCVRAKYVLPVLQVTTLPRQPAADHNRDDQDEDGDEDEEDGDEEDGDGDEEDGDGDEEDQDEDGDQDEDQDEEDGDGDDDIMMSVS